MELTVNDSKDCANSVTDISERHPNAAPSLFDPPHFSKPRHVVSALGQPPRQRQHEHGIVGLAGDQGVAVCSSLRRLRRSETYQNNTERVHMSGIDPLYLPVLFPELREHWRDDFVSPHLARQSCNDNTRISCAIPSVVHGAPLAPEIRSPQGPRVARPAADRCTRTQPRALLQERGHASCNGHRRTLPARQNTAHGPHDDCGGPNAAD
mmetsp:Transcript_1984/g.4533  ORF Transcript_1984/g.4533 Transcript_1984/m.4533 type:complete len:209 (+) Transcript_1984:248-874(+)